MLKEVRGPADIPSTPHFAIMIFETQYVHHEGDQRSKDHPGHGYPAHTEEIRSFKHFVTENEEEARIEIEKLYRQKPQRTDVAFFKVSHKIGVSLVAKLQYDT